MHVLQRTLAELLMAPPNAWSKDDAEVQAMIIPPAILRNHMDSEAKTIEYVRKLKGIP